MVIHDGAQSGLGSDTSSLEDLTIHEILERGVSTQTVIDILREAEDFKVGNLTAFIVSLKMQCWF